MQNEREYRLVGGITGPMWMGGTGWKEHDARLSRNEHEPWTEHLHGFRDTLESILARHGGAFNGARFTGDTYVEVYGFRTDATGRRQFRHSHILELVNCPSVADLVDESVYSTDGEDDF